jgi:hypothetical protein
MRSTSLPPDGPEPTGDRPDDTTETSAPTPMKPGRRPGSSRLARCPGCNELEIKAAMVDGYCSDCYGQTTLPFRDDRGRFLNLHQRPTPLGW